MKKVLKGSVSGFGITENKTKSDYLLTTTLSIVDCLKYSDETVKSKFCVSGNGNLTDFFLLL